MSREDIDKQERAMEQFHWLLEEYSEAFWFAGRLGDGEGGYILDCLRKKGLVNAPLPPDRKRKATIPHRLRKRVFERDAYRCQHCGSWEDLCADHISPESKGGETTEDNLQTLCRTCNAVKGDRSE